MAGTVTAAVTGELIVTVLLSVALHAPLVTVKVKVTDVPELTTAEASKLVGFVINTPAVGLELH